MVVKGAWTCRICGRDFPLIFEEHYTARNTSMTGLAAAIASRSEPAIYDAFDCPHCGCQNIMQERRRNTVEAYAEEEPDEEEEE